MFADDPTQTRLDRVADQIAYAYADAVEQVTDQLRQDYEAAFGPDYRAKYPFVFVADGNEVHRLALALMRSNKEVDAQ